MSIQKRSYPPSKRYPRGRTTWRVRWVEQAKHRSRDVATHAAAKALDAEKVLAAQADTTTPTATPQMLLAPTPVAAAPPATSPVTLTTFWNEWITNRALRCAPSTIKSYKGAWGKHVTPSIGKLPLTELAANPRLISDLLAKMAQTNPKTGRPRVGSPTRRKVFMLLTCVMRTAVAWNHIDVSPMTRLDEKAPSQKRSRAIVVFSALHVEAMRLRLLARTGQGGGIKGGLDRTARNLRDVAMLTLLAYAGLRPAEAMALRWSSIDFATARVSVLARNSDTVTRDVKSDASLRTVPLTPALLADLRAWHAAAGAPGGDELVFANGGEMWSKEEWRRWADKTFLPAAKAVMRAGSRPYDLRHSFIMRLVMQGQPIPVVASLAGHTPEMTVKVYLGAYKEHAQVGIRPGEDLDLHFTRAREDAPTADFTREAACITVAPTWAPVAA